jgi:AcrR family transcriptional regulator
MISDTFTHGGVGGGLDESLSAIQASFHKTKAREFTRHYVSVKYSLYSRAVPKLWSQTVETHRREVRDAILDSTIGLVADHGFLSVTMSEIAETTGIGRATLYKYFPDVEAILRAWHERQIAHHLEELREARATVDDPAGRLSAVFNTYARIAHESRGHRDTELAALLHGHHESHTQAEQKLRRMVRGLLRDAATAGMIRNDVSPDELAEYCLHALSASNTLPSKPAVRRLVEITLRGLAPAD